MKVQIRFNTDKLKSPELNLPEWRVLCDGKERLARSVQIQVPSWTTVDEIAPGVMKWHITCEGSLVWDDASERVAIT